MIHIMIIIFTGCWINHATDFADIILYKCYKFFARNVNMLTLSGFREDLLGVTTSPDVVNSHSDAELKCFCASCDTNGYLPLYNFHHGRISSSASSFGSDK